MFIGYKAPLTALIVIRRHLLGQKVKEKWASVTDMHSDLRHILPELEGEVAAAGLRK